MSTKSTSVLLLMSSAHLVMVSGKQPSTCRHNYGLQNWRHHQKLLVRESRALPKVTFTTARTLSFNYPEELWRALINNDDITWTPKISSLSCRFRRAHSDCCPWSRFVHMAISPHVMSAPKRLHTRRKGRFPHCGRTRSHIIRTIHTVFDVAWYNAGWVVFFFLPIVSECC